jgi:hypothetical protein
VIAVAPSIEAPAVGECLRRAVRDFYEESWRLVVLNCTLSTYVLVVLAVAFYFPVFALLLLGVGPLAAGLVATAGRIVEEGSVTFRETVADIRRTWRRGLVLVTFAATAAVATVGAAVFYGGRGTVGWTLAVLVLYLGGIFALFQLVLWPLAIRDPSRPLREAARDAGHVLLRRPAATTGLGVALLAVNLVGLVAAVLPFLTMTIAYSALAAARFTLPLAPLEEG